MQAVRWSPFRSPRLLRGQLAQQWLRQPHRHLVSAAELQFGQPVPETHPHLLKPGELTPGISALEYYQRRNNLAASLPPNSVAILAAADIKTRSGAVFYKFHQDPNFLYLTGFNEPDALAVIEKDSNGSSHVFHLYCRGKDPKTEKWEGSRSGIQAAQDVFNADEAGSIDNVLNSLSKVITTGRTVFTDIPTEAKAGSTFTKIVFGSSRAESGTIDGLLQRASVRPLRPYLNELRCTKSDAEIACMKKAGEASGKAFTEAMGVHFHTERDLDTFLDFRFKSHGCEESAYVPVVAGAENALQIHYVRNDAMLMDGDLVTVDAGGEHGGYVTDITRAWPVSGRFTEAQRDMYNMILEVQKKVVALCTEEASTSLDGLQSVTESGLRSGLSRLGFDMSRNALDILFPHHVGHYLGLAVHDLPGHPRTGKLKRNHVVTVEPGIYVEDDLRWPKHFRGIGIRIEDSICIGETSPMVLTKEAVKEVEDIEALRG